MKKLLAPIIIFFLIICTSCKDNKEIHEISFVSSIGIDYKIDTNEYEVILYFINTINNVRYITAIFFIARSSLKL